MQNLAKRFVFCPYFSTRVKYVSRFLVDLIYNKVFTLDGTDFTLHLSEESVMAYLLLRSNKQSGPYSVQELIAQGLKPYDLIWAEGKSAAWRYPSEIEELKEFAPVVEEQPYDRFYKKQESEKHFHETVVGVKAEVKSEIKKEPLLQPKLEHTTPVIKAEEPKVEIPPTPVIEQPPVIIAPPAIEKPVEEPIVEKTFKKPFKVFVSLPTRNGSSATVQKEEAPVVPVRHETPVIPISKMEPEPAKEELREEYSQPLDEIKRMYMENYIQRQKKSNNRFRIMNYVKYAGVAVFIIVLGSFVYSAIRMDSKVKPLYSPESSNQTPPKNVKKVNAVKNNNYDPADNNKTILSTIDENNEELKNETPVTKTKNKNQPTDTEQPPLTTPEDFSTDEVVTTETNTAKSNRNLGKPADLNTLVSVNANKYKRKAFGGIQDLELTVRNDSKYILDKVMVELQYLKPSEQPLKSEIYYFNAVAPNGSLTIQIPDNPRGIKVTYKITHIVSTQFDQDIAGL